MAQQQQQCREGETLHLRTFRLQWNFEWEVYHLDTWLRTDAALKVEELDLCFDFSRLPHSIFSCRSRTTLIGSEIMRRF